MLRAAQEANHLFPTRVPAAGRARRAARHGRRHRRGVRVPVLRRGQLHHRPGHRRQRRSSHMSDRFDLDGRVAIITGGGTGIGRGAALVLAEHGADVVLAGRRPEPLQSTAAEIEALGRRALPFSTDVTSPQQCEQLVDDHAGRVRPRRHPRQQRRRGAAPSRSRWSEEEWHHVIALNLGGGGLPVAGGRQADDRAGQGRDRQHLLGRQPARHAAGGALRRRQSRGEQPHRIDGRRLDPQGRARQRHRGRRGPGRDPARRRRRATGSTRKRSG